MTDVMKERLMMISEYNTGDFSVSELARRRGVSRKTVHKWIERYERKDVDGLWDQSREPHGIPTRFPQRWSSLY